MLVLAVEREPEVERVQNQPFLADVDITTRAEGAELAVGTANVDDADEGVLGIILPAEIVEEETLARAAFGRDHKIIIVDARIEEVECDELTLAAHIEQGRAAATATGGLDRHHQPCRHHRHPETPLEPL